MSTNNSFRERLTTRFSRSSNQTIMRWTFFSAGMLFAAVCIIGVITRSIVDATGILSAVLQGRARFDLSSSNNISVQPLIIAISISSALILVSVFCTFVWSFRTHLVSKTFILFNYAVYALAQGIGFGILFMALNSVELFSVFGISGGLLLLMSAVGFFIKNGNRLLPYLAIGVGASLILSIVAIALFFAGIYSDSLIVILLSCTGVVMCLALAVDFFYIKQSAQYQTLNSASDPDANFRFIAWWGFRLASDFVQLVWIIARLFLRFSR